MRGAYGRIIHVYSPDADHPLRRVSISGLSFNAAFFTSNGAAMGTDGRTDLQLEHCVFSNNTSNGKAGALYVGVGGTVSFTGCTFVSNHARLDSAANASVVSLNSEADHSVSFQD
jgi:hypothetical protein